MLDALLLDLEEGLKPLEVDVQHVDVLLVHDLTALRQVLLRHPLHDREHLVEEETAETNLLMLV